MQWQPSVPCNTSMALSHEQAHSLSNTMTRQDLICCRRHGADAGSSEVQVAQLTGRIVHITKHLQRNRKDKASQQGLLCLLSHRKKLLKYMYREDKRAFARCIRDLGIRNPILGVRVRGEKASKEKASQRAGTK